MSSTSLPELVEGPEQQVGDTHDPDLFEALRQAQGAESRRWLAPVAIAVPVVVFAIHGARYGRWLVDDALISFAYARTLSEGGGFAQHVGEAPVEGASNPTWTLLLAGLRLVGVFDRGHRVLGVEDYVLTVKGVALLLFVVTLALVHRTARALLGPGAGPAAATGLAGLLLALSPTYVIWAVSGLENPLYGAFVAGLAALLCSAVTPRPATAVAAAALVLLLAGTRPDGLIFAAAYPAVLLAETVTTSGRHRPTSRHSFPLLAAVTYAAALGLPLGALLLWRHAVFGLWVPNTAVAKGQRIDPGAMLDRLRDLSTAAGTPVVVAGLVAVVVALVLSWRRRDESFPVAGLAVPFVLACAAFLVLNRDWMAEYRFATPAAVLGSTLLGVCVARCLTWASPRAWRALVAGMTVLLVAATAVAAAPRTAAFARNPTVPGCYVADRYGRLTDFYADRLGIASGTYLVPDIGGVLLTSRLRVVDLAGLTEPTIARLRGREDTAGIRDYVLEQVRPTFVHVHRPWDAGLLRDPRFRRDYLPIVRGADFVRRDAAREPDVAALRPVAEQRARAIGQTRINSPRRSCGTLADH